MSIQSIENFDIRSKIAMDKRLSVNSLNDIELPYEGMVCYQKSDKTLYEYKDGAYTPLVKDIKEGLSLLQIAKAKLEQGVDSTLSFNSSPHDAKCFRLLHGDTANPTTDGNSPTMYVGRVDGSYANDATKNNPGILIPVIYSSLTKTAESRGWGYTNIAYLEDKSLVGVGNKSQTVASAGMAYASGDASIWGIYGDAYSLNPLATITGAEFDAQNMSGEHYNYNEANPVGVPFSCAVWNMSFGTKDNSFGVGIGGGGASKWGAGIFIALASCKKFAVDIQATPSTLINFKYGATVDGANAVFAGVGLDTGAISYFTTASGATRQNTGAMHLRNHRICAGNGAWLQFNSTSGEWQLGVTDALGVDTVWASLGSASGWVAGGTAMAGAC